MCDVCECDDEYDDNKKDKIRPILFEKPDVLTDEGKKKFLEKAKNQTIENYKNELRSKTEDELTEKAMEEAAKELGVSIDELSNPRRLGLRRYFRDKNKVTYTEEQINYYVQKISEIQKRQNTIIELMTTKEKHLIMDKSHTRNAVVTEYLHLEKLKCRFLDIITCAYTGNAEAQDVVNIEGSKFTTADKSLID